MRLVFYSYSITYMYIDGLISNGSASWSWDSAYKLQVPPLLISMGASPAEEGAIMRRRNLELIEPTSISQFFPSLMIPQESAWDAIQPMRREVDYYIQ